MCGCLQDRQCRTNEVTTILPVVIDAAISSDPAAGVGISAALAAGVVSFLSPCVLPLVPGYLSAVSGVSTTELDSAGWRRVLGPSLLFVTSFSSIFILLGLTATALGSFLQDHELLLSKIAGALIVGMGLLFLASPFVARLNREWHVDALLERGWRGGPRWLPAPPSRSPGLPASVPPWARSSPPPH